MSYNEKANITKVLSGLDGRGGEFFRNAQVRSPKFSFKDGNDRSVKAGETRGDIPKLPIVDSWNQRR